MIYRQGDVLLVQVQSVPEQAELTETGDKITLAYGEATGHHHRIDEAPGKAKLWSAEAERFLQVMETVGLRHEEHSTVTLPPGIYRVAIQREYTPAELRRVTD